MGRTSVTAVGIACTVAMMATACGSDDEADDDGDGGVAAEGGTLDIGLVNSLTGPASVGGPGLRAGVDARFAAYEEDGGECADELDFTIVEVDEQSSPQGHLAAVQRLIQQEEVYAILQASSVGFGGIDFLTTEGEGTPVLGFALDGPAPQWLEFDNNLFSAFPLPVADNVYSTLGDFLSGEGATKLAGVSFANPASQAGMENGLAAAEAAGVETVYTNTSIPFGSTDVGPLVLGIVESGADAVYMAITPDTGLAAVAGLRQAGWEGTILLPTGYGPELLESEPALAVAQGVTFTTALAPFELHSEASDRMAEAVAEQTGGEPGPVGFFAGTGWVSADLFLYGLEAAGCDATQQEFIDTLRENTEYDAGGLFPQPADFSSADYPESCSYFLTLEGEEFVLAQEEPVCGELVEG